VNFLAEVDRLSRKQLIRFKPFSAGDLDLEVDMDLVSGIIIRGRKLSPPITLLSVVYIIVK